MTTEQIVINIAILEAKDGQRDALRDALSALVSPTRKEAGCLDYVLFELVDRPGVFYMREAFRNQEALETHFSMPYFQAFAQRFDELLAQPLQLVALKKIA